MAHTRTPFAFLGLLVLLAAPCRAAWTPELTGSRPEDYDFSRGGILWDAYLHAKPGASREEGAFGSLTYWLDGHPYRGTRVRFYADLRPQEVDGDAWAGLFVRVDSVDGRVLFLDDMRSRPVKGTAAKPAFYEIVFDMPSDMLMTIAVGVHLNRGQGWLFVKNAMFEKVGRRP